MRSLGAIRERRPSPATAVALLALFVALGGTALALERDSVKSKHIKDGKVKSVDVKDEGLTGDDLSDGSVTDDDLDAFSVGRSEVKAAAVDGLRLARAEVTVDPTSTTLEAPVVDSIDTGTSTAFCAGPLDKLVSGGVEFSGNQNGDLLGVTEVVLDPAAGRVDATAFSGETAARKFHAYAVCIPGDV